MSLTRVTALSLLVLLFVALIVIGSGSPGVSAQGTLSAPGNVTAHDGLATGEVVITWNAVPNAQFYRIGWVAFEDYQEVTGAGREWLEAFAFVDVANRAQTSHTVKRLTPGLLSAFVVATNDSRYGEPRWSEWARLTLSGDTGACPTTQPESSPETDRAALVALYNSTGGANWANNANWLSDEPLGEWYGVTVDGNGRVTVVDLHENGLTGRLPSQLGNLTNLTHLVLWNNELTGLIPSEFWS